MIQLSYDKSIFMKHARIKTKQAEEKKELAHQLAMMPNYIRRKFISSTVVEPLVPCPPYLFWKD